MSKMVERVARAKWAAVAARNPTLTYIPYDDLPERSKAEMKGDARAAIAALREPPEAMCLSSALDSKLWEETYPADVWRAMIDVALSD